MRTLTSEPNFMASHTIVVETFHTKPNANLIVALEEEDHQRFRAGLCYDIEKNMCAQSDTTQGERERCKSCLCHITIDITVGVR